MDLLSIKIIKDLLAQQETRPRKGLGQNFLTSKGALADILKAAQLTKEDTVLEIGPGIGTLTRALAQSAKRVLAVEKDPAMVQILQQTTQDLSNVEIICADILKLGETRGSLDLTKVRGYKVVANLPYYITSPVIRMLLEAENGPELMVLMVQKEVAQRICAKPPHMSLLAVSVQVYGKPSIASYVKKNCFWPQPKVDSAILQIVPHSLVSPRYPQLNRIKFFEVVKAGFKQPRKQLLNNLSQGLGLSKQTAETWLNQVGIAPTQRAETLSVENWLALAESLPKTYKPSKTYSR